MIYKAASFINYRTLTAESSIRVTLDLGECTPEEMYHLHELRRNVVIGMVLSNETDLNDFIKWKEEQPQKDYQPLITTPGASKESSTPVSNSDGT